VPPDPGADDVDELATLGVDVKEEGTVLMLGTVMLDVDVTGAEVKSGDPIDSGLTPVLLAELLGRGRNVEQGQK
jgi:hypothetical protein